MRPQPLIAVHDVEKSSAWYQKILSANSGHGGVDYEQILYNGDMILQLHRWEAHHHPHLGRESTKPYGNGVLLWFQTDDFDAAVRRANKLGAEILEPAHINSNARHREIWLRDPDGYAVVIAGPYGDLGAA